MGLCLNYLGRVRVLKNKTCTGSGWTSLYADRVRVQPNPPYTRPVAISNRDWIANVLDEPI